MTIVFARNQYSLDSFLKKGCKNVFHEKKSCKRIEGRESFDGRVDLGGGKESKKKRKKSRRREGVESVGIPLKVVVKVVRLVAEEKQRGSDKEVRRIDREMGGDVEDSLMLKVK